jgi:hypothetical protein
MVTCATAISFVPLTSSKQCRPDPSTLQAPPYFRTHTHEDLYDLKKSPYAYAVGLEGLTYYEAISHDPDRFNMFNMTLTQMEKSVPILGMLPFESLKKEVEAEPEIPLIVDIGGGRGQALLAIQGQALGRFGAKMILQDRPDVLDSLTEEDIPGIEKMAYDFFTPQPVKSNSSKPPVHLALVLIVA